MVGGGLANMIGINTCGGQAGAGGGGGEFSNLYSCAFDGIDSYIDCGDVSGLDGATTASWSVWVYIDDANDNYVMSQWSASTADDRQFMLFCKPSTNRWDVYCGSNISYRRTDIVTTTGAWHHVAVTYNASNTAKERVILYLDGTQYIQTTYNGPTSLKASPASSFNIGRRTDFTFFEFEGEIDEVSIWTTELSQTEVDAIYNLGTPTDLSTSGISGLIHWWRNGDPTGTGAFPTIVDQVGSNNGTMINMLDTDIVTSVP